MILSEAFKQLDMLTEETFSIDKDGLEELKDFEEKDEVIETADIIDPNAESEEELEDSYVGKVILDCCVCHSKLYKDAEEVVLSEDETVANADEECPFCYSTDGFKVIGQVSAFEEKGEETEDEVEEVDEKKEEEVKDKEELGEGLFDFDKKKREKEGKVIQESAETKYVLEFEKMNGPDKGWFKMPRNPEPDLESEFWFTRNKKEATVFTSIEEAKRVWDEYIVGMPLISEDDDVDFGWSFEDVLTTVSNDVNESKSIRESIENLSMDTEDIHMEMTSDDEGKVTISTEPRKQNTEGDEVITPLDVEVQTEIENNDPDNIEDTEVELDEFDEKSFNDLGESYLKKVYDNVKFFKTTDVKSTAKNLIVEGVIQFNSGKSKKTTFIFESKVATRSGKVKFLGENKEITKGNKAFTIKGSIKDKKLISESLTYNYRIKDADGKSSRLYGTVKVGK